jgi:DnaJ-class molecular chaperone
MNQSCPHCNGTGLTGRLHLPAEQQTVFDYAVKGVIVEQPCSKCGGTGVVKQADARTTATPETS